ncbi:MAG: glutathione S-transferase N-terminal domain-containing protein [Alphaproteobacteria bacterium]|nr:glutathione S-transferase N-terminal domain-containing protein [Alphaproteobacteria bacterium]
MTLYGHPWSINTRKVLVTAAEKGHALTLSFVNLPRGAHKAAAHLALHPFGKVPVLDDDGFVLYETAAIMRYLDEALDGPALWPDDPQARARALQWDRVQQSYFEPPVHGLLVHALFSRHLGFPPDPAVLQAGRAALGQVLDVIEPALRAAPFLAGEGLSLADLTWLPYLEYLTQIGEGAPIEARPGVRAWFERLSSRPSWQAVARTGMQPYDADADADAFAQQAA